MGLGFGWGGVAIGPEGRFGGSGCANAGCCEPLRLVVVLERPGFSLGLLAGRFGEGSTEGSWGLSVWSRARLDGMGQLPLRGIGVEDGCVGGGCRDECRVDGVRTNIAGEGMAVVWDGVEAEPERFGES